MSNLLSTVQTGLHPTPPRIVLHGTPGVGKSTFAAHAPNPIFIQTEDGLGQIDTSKFPVATTLQQVYDQLDALATEKHDFETVVIDSLDRLESLIWAKLCADFHVKVIEKVDGGYGKGYVYALNEWQRVLEKVDALRNRRGMMAILISHTKTATFVDPELASYDTWTLALDKRAMNLIHGWADAILFASFRIRVDTDTNKARPTGADGGERTLRAVGGPACLAKNRYGFPATMPLDWSAVEKVLFKE